MEIPVITAKDTPIALLMKPRRLRTELLVTASLDIKSDEHSAVRGLIIDTVGTSDNDDIGEITISSSNSDAVFIILLIAPFDDIFLFLGSLFAITEQKRCSCRKRILGYRFGNI